jgi:[ribosomal protein S5]-alanine N-acetyltransferase
MVETNRLLLRKWNESDYLDLYEYAQDERVGPNAGWPPHKNEEESKAIVKMFIENDDTYAIVLKDENKVIGSIGLHERYPDVSVAELRQKEIGYVLNHSYWGNGYVPEAVRAVLKFGFEEMNLDLIWCGHFDFNSNSKRVIEKCGFRYKFNKDVALPLLDGKIVNELYYQITRDDYFRG